MALKQDSYTKLTQSIGKAIAKYRQASGLSQAQLAELIGVGNDAISRMERGTIVPTITRLAELASIFKCGITDLLSDGSYQVQDQLIYINQLLTQLEESDRQILIEIIKVFVQSKQGKVD